MKRTLLLGSLVMALLMGAGATASAQTDTASDGDARALFERGRTAYDAGQFDEATRAFRRAYLLSPRFALLYNIGQSELRAGRDGLALAAFEGYLRQAPANDARRSEVEERARVLRSMGVEPTTGAATPTATPTETTPPAGDGDADTTPSEPEPARVAPRHDGPGAAPWILVGGGGALLVGGVVMMIVGMGNAGTVNDAPAGSMWSELEGTASSANLLWGVGMALAGVGLAAAGVGLVWALTGSSSSEAEPQAATAQLRLGIGSLSLEGKF